MRIQFVSYLLIFVATMSAQLSCADSIITPGMSRTDVLLAVGEPIERAFVEPGGIEKWRYAAWTVEFRSGKAVAFKRNPNASISRVITSERVAAPSPVDIDAYDRSKAEVVQDILADLTAVEPQNPQG